MRVREFVKLLSAHCEEVHIQAYNKQRKMVFDKCLKVDTIFSSEYMDCEVLCIDFANGILMIAAPLFELHIMSNPTHATKIDDTRAFETRAALINYLNSFISKRFNNSEICICIKKIY